MVIHICIIRLRVWIISEQEQGYVKHMSNTDDMEQEIDRDKRYSIRHVYERLMFNKRRIYFRIQYTWCMKIIFTTYLDDIGKTWNYKSTDPKLIRKLLLICSAFLFSQYEYFSWSPRALGINQTRHHTESLINYALDIVSSR